MRAGLASGELSYSKVRAISRAPAGEDEAGLVDLARSATAGEVEQVVRALRSAPSAGVDVVNDAHARRFVAWSWELDGSLSIRARLPAEDGAAFIEMIETATAALDHSSDRPPWGACRADALAEIAHSGSPRTQLVVHVDSAALACTADEPDERAGEVCELENGPALPSESARRLGCDAAVITARRAQDGSVDYGRQRRTVPAALRTVLERRDRCCRFPGCERRHDLHAHHLVHWAHGGATRKENLVLLCRFHHRLVHEGGFGIQGARDGTFRFVRPDGRVVAVSAFERDPARSARGQPVAA
jgi:hypothetical protein